MKTKVSRKRKLAGAVRQRPVVLKCILVPLDFSSGSQEALSYAKMLANHSGATLQLLHVMNIGFYGSDVAYLYCDLLKAKLNANSEMQRVLKSLKGFNCGVRISEGTPYREIISTAREVDADLIVLGSHGYTRLERFILGSTAERVVRHAKCPVLVVRSGKPKSGIQTKRTVRHAAPPKMIERNRRVATGTYG